MKTKRTIYFILMVIGGLIMGFGKGYMEKEYALSIGIVLLMFGIYKSTQVWSDTRVRQEEGEDENEE
ncbi:hypothetical protein [Spongiimicrobium salis]|uniref:hypothetical protein n=1 Tax=Spongiimicrobium salis TaxID=1667022 RepID=UPI00374C9B3C